MNALLLVTSVETFNIHEKVWMTVGYTVPWYFFDVVQRADTRNRGTRHTPEKRHSFMDHEGYGE